MTALQPINIWDTSTYPTKRSEDWRWTDVGSLIRKAPEVAPEIEPDVSGGPFKSVIVDDLTIANGRFSDGSNQATVVFNGSTLALTRFVTAGEGVGWQASVSYTVKAGAHVTLLESYEGSGSYLSNAVMVFALEPGASLERIIIADDAPDSVSISTADVRLSAGAKFEQTVLTWGAKRQRIETRVVHPGHGAAVRMDGAYVLADKRHADITTVVAHEGVDGATTQLTKGVVRDQARGIFQGRIVVAEGADRADARMGHHALILSERAEVDAKPELLIYADDVQCAHGNTIGALDEDAIFYARQRGIPDDVARAMLTEAFVGEVIDRIQHDGAREVARAWAAKRLGGG